MVGLSAISGEGCDRLLKLIDDKISVGFEVCEFELNVAEGKKIAWLHANSDVISCKANEDKMHFKVKISQENLSKFKFDKLKNLCYTDTN